MKISLVKEAQLEDVYALYKETIADMQARDLDQWTWGVYPYEGLLQNDVKLGQLYCFTDEGGALCGVFAACVGQDADYDPLAWQYGTKPVCLHRLAIRPSCGRHGLARQAIEFTKQIGLQNGCDCFRVDTYSHNARALALFGSVTVRRVGVLHFPPHTDDFIAFEAPLTDDCPLLPFRMSPAYRYGDMTPWGGDALKRLYGKAIPDARTGEALEISCIPKLESLTDMGETLPDVIAREGARLVGSEESTFPLLLKLLAARDNLSVQVHPNDEYAMEHEHKLGKTEAWVILHAEQGAKLLYGIKEGVTLDELRAGLESGADIEPLIASIEVSEGDVLYMPSGMVHAIGGGITLYEIQQSSDVTYRLWDYNRTNDKGEKRPLHIKQSLDVIDPALRGKRTTLPAADELGEHVVLNVPAFKLSCLCVKGEAALSVNRESFRMFTALSPMTLAWQGGSLALAAGESALIPAAAPALTVKGEGRALLSAVK